MGCAEPAEDPPRDFTSSVVDLSQPGKARTPNIPPKRVSATLKATFCCLSPLLPKGVLLEASSGFHSDMYSAGFGGLWWWAGGRGDARVARN